MVVFDSYRVEMLVCLELLLLEEVLVVLGSEALIFIFEMLCLQCHFLWTDDVLFTLRILSSILDLLNIS